MDPSSSQNRQPEPMNWTAGSGFTAGQLHDQHNTINNRPGSHSAARLAASTRHDSNVPTQSTPDYSTPECCCLRANQASPKIDPGRCNCECIKDDESEGEPLDGPTATRNAESAWSDCAKRLRNHDEQMVKAWKEEIDTLLVFAGLFSAVLTTFIVQIFPMLQPAQQATPDLNTQILMQIASQLSGQELLVTSSNSTIPAAQSPTTATVWTNILWFFSLVLSLSAASIGIVVRQWLNYFISPSVSHPKLSAYIHCIRYDLGLVGYIVPQTFALLPILLQTALVLFLVGLVVLLYNLNFYVAGPTSLLVAILLSWQAVCTVLPYFDQLCPFKSPQALFACWVLQYLVNWFWNYVHQTMAALFVPTFLRQQLRVISNRMKKPFQNWTMQEHSIITDSTKHLEWVERNIFSCAGALLMDDSFFVDVISPLLSDPNEDIELMIHRLEHIVDGSTLMSPTSRRTVTKMVINITSRVPTRLSQRFFQICYPPILRNLDSELATSAFINCATLGGTIIAGDSVGAGELARSKAIMSTLMVIQQSRFWDPTMVLQHATRSKEWNYKFAQDAIDIAINFISQLPQHYMELLEGYHVAGLVPPEDQQQRNRAVSAFCVALYLSSIYHADHYHEHLRERVDEMLEAASDVELLARLDWIHLRREQLRSQLLIIGETFHRQYHDSSVFSWMQDNFIRPQPLMRQHTDQIPGGDVDGSDAV